MSYTNRGPKSYQRFPRTESRPADQVPAGERRAITSRYDAHCANRSCVTALPAGTTVYWARGFGAICGLCYEAETTPPAGAPEVDGDALEAQGLDALTDEALSLSRTLSDSYDDDGGQGQWSERDLQRFRDARRGLDLVDAELARRNALLRPFGRPEVEAIKALSDRDLGVALRDLETRYATHQGPWAERIGIKMHLAGTLAESARRDREADAADREIERQASGEPWPVEYAGGDDDREYEPMYDADEMDNAEVER